jgi:hypothetical protein
MKKITIFGIDIVDRLVGENNRLMYLTQFSKHLLPEIGKAVKEASGNVLIAEFPQETITLYFGKEIPISIKANNDLVKSAVITSLKDDQTMVEYMVDEKPYNPTLRADKKLRDKVIRALISLIISENVSVLIVDKHLSRLITNVLVKKFGKEFISFFTDENKSGVDAWNSWRIYCREMQMMDEFPLTFAGVQNIPFAMVGEQKRPANTFLEWSFKTEEEMAMS